MCALPWRRRQSDRFTSTHPMQSVSSDQARSLQHRVGLVCVHENEARFLDKKCTWAYSPHALRAATASCMGTRGSKSATPHTRRAWCAALWEAWWSCSGELPKCTSLDYARHFCRRLRGSHGLGCSACHAAALALLKAGCQTPPKLWNCTSSQCGMARRQTHLPRALYQFCETIEMCWVPRNVHEVSTPQPRWQCASI